MSNIITSKNSWELLLSSIAGAWDGADTFILGTFDEMENYGYKVKVTNSRTGSNIAEHITQIKVSIPDSSEKISSMKAEFVLDEKVVQTGDVIVVEIFNSTESAQVKLLEGKAKITNRDIGKIYNTTYTIEVVDEFDKLFEKIVSEDTFLFNKYIYAEQYKENSILYIIAKSLGFTDDQLNFEDVRDSQSRLVQIPFMLLRKDNRYIDELQTILEVTKGRIYVDSYKNIVFKNGLFDYEKAVAYQFDTRNILRSIGEGYKYTDKNGVRVLYDSYKYLENQVIFDLANRVEVKTGTNSENQKMEFNIKFITDLAVQHNITKAEGYYYVDEEQIRVPLQEGVHYELVEFRETSAKVKFFNPYSSLFFIDKFEIKGIPLVQFQDNEVAIKETKNMEEREENFSSYTKNKYIQTEELASDIARVEYIRNCKNKKEYSFKSNFVPHLEPGDVCSFKLDDIDTLIEISSIEHTLSRSNGCYSEITALEYERIEQEFNYSKIESLTAKDSFLGTLNNIKDQIDETDKKLDEVILIEGARGYVDENDPRDSGKEVAEPDVWFNPITKEFKVWRNGKWNPAREEDIPPALMTALKAQAGVFRIGGNDVEAGIFFQYDKDTNNPVFGSTDSENLAQVSIDKDANVLIRNANNKLAFNMRNPENPSEIISQMLMGVYNADDEKHKNTMFQVGDESTGTYIKFTRGEFHQSINGKEIVEYFENFEEQIDGKIDTYNQKNDPSSNWTEEQKRKAIGDLWYNPDEKVTKRWNGTSWDVQDVKDSVAQDIAKGKNTVFTTIPSPPYKIGDLWIKNSEIYSCIKARETGSYSESDWNKSLKYTDDTKANEAKKKAEEAEKSAETANSKLSDISSDNKLTASEKQSTKKDWDVIVAEYPQNIDQAKIYGVSYTDYTNKYNSLNTYITPLLTNIETTSDIVGSTFRSNFKNYYDARLVLLNSISSAIKALADNAQNTGNQALENQNNGNLVISSATTFTGDAEFVSKGSNETTIIKDGSITFTRDGQAITVIRNIKIGTIATDGDGTGRITFTGFKNLDVLTSIKSFHIGTNTRSLNTYATCVDVVANTWKFFVFGTEAVLGNAIKDYITFDSFQASFSLTFVRLVGESMKLRLGNTGVLWDKDSAFTGGNATWNITATASIRVEVYCNNSLGNTLIGLFDGTTSITPRGYKAGSRCRVTIDSQDVYVPISISRDNTTSLTSTISIKVTRANFSISGTVTARWDANQDNKTVEVSASGSLLAYSSSRFDYNYSKEVIQDYSGEGEVQYVAIEK